MPLPLLPPQGAPNYVRAEERDIVHSGPLNVPIPGRTDHIPLSVRAGSYVVPADVVSGIGEGNTLAGTRVLHHMFSTGPYGTPLPRAPHAHVKHRAEGGDVDEDGHPTVPVVVAGGEYIIPPEAIVAHFGDLDHGHDVLDQWVKNTRAQTIKTLKGLPGPKRD